MPAKPSLTMRVATEFRDLLRQVNARLDDDPAFAQALQEMLDDPTRTRFLPEHEINARFEAIEARLDRGKL